MVDQNLSQELDDEELDEIEQFLARAKGGAIANAEVLDGFLTALVISPEVVMPSEYMQVIISGETEEDDLVFENIEEAEHFYELVVRHWNAINGTFRKGEIYMPVLAEDDDGIVSGNDWAKGFLKGAQLRFDPWAEIFDDEEHGGVLVPILALAHEHDPDPEMRTYDEPVSPELRQDLITHMIAGARQLYDLFEEQRQTGASDVSSGGTFRRQTPKVGRNQPCPCGSGKKFKNCCGNVTLH